MTGFSPQKGTFDTEAYWQERLSETYDLDGVGYTGLSHSYNQWLYRIRRHNFHRVVRTLDLGKSPRILDVGSGTGFYVDLWEEIGAESVVGIDIAEVAVQNLRDRFPDYIFFQGDISEALPPEIEGGFDAVSAMDVLFHIVDDNKHKRALENIHSLLRQDGFFLFTGNFLHNDTDRYKHIVHRSLERTSQVLRSTGFEIVDRWPVFMIMNEPVDSPPDLIQHLWPRISRIASHSEFAGQIIGSVLFPLEMLLTCVYSESPTTEIMLCKKR